MALTSLYSETLEMEMWARVRDITLMDGREIQANRVIATMRDSIVVDLGYATLLVSKHAVATATMAEPEPQP